MHKFQQTGAGILVSAERTLRTDQTVEHLYPDSESAGDYKYLNVGMFIGYLSPITELLSGSIRNGDSDQLIFERAYLDANVRTKLMIQLDHRASIFQNLHGSIGNLYTHFSHRAHDLNIVSYSSWFSWSEIRWRNGWKKNAERCSRNHTVDYSW